MKKQVLKKIFSCVCSCVMVISLSISAYAENEVAFYMKFV